MISKEALAAAARIIDNAAEKDGLESVFDDLGTDIQGALYLADQRALRSWLAARFGEEGMNATIALGLPVQIPVDVQLMLQAAWIDGYAIGRGIDRVVDTDTLLEKCPACKGKKFMKTTVRDDGSIVDHDPCKVCGATGLKIL